MEAKYFRYENQKCPVCNKEFEADADIVVCPVCGTPHHRDCYKQNGECGNNEKHCEGYRWEPEALPESEYEPAAEAPNENGQPFFENRGGQYGANDGQQPPFYGNPAANPFSLFPPELEDGVTTEEAASYVQMNAMSYLQRFFHQKAGKSTFNWAAFFFAPYWFFVRKLYKIGSVFLAVLFVLTAASTLAPPVQRLMKEFMPIYTEYLDDDSAAADEELIRRAQPVFENNRAGIAILSVRMLLAAALHIVAGAKANKWYYKKTLEEIKEIKASVPDPNLQKMTVFRRGGMSVGAPILAVMADSVLTMALQLIIQI